MGQAAHHATMRGSITLILFCCGIAAAPASHTVVSPLDQEWFKGKVAVVTGGASGIGLALARRCKNAGSRVVLSDGNPVLLRQAVNDMCAESPKDKDILSVVADVRKQDDMSNLLRVAIDRFGRVDVVFSNAGVIGEPDKGVVDTGEASWRWVLDTNVMGLVNAIHAFVPHLEAQGTESHFVVTASGAGLYSQHRVTMGPYVASKHCAVVIAQALDTELRSKASPVKAHVICPSVVASPLVHTSRWYLGKDKEPLDTVSQSFDAKLNSDGMSPDMVAALTLEGIRAGRFFVITHPNITATRVQARSKEILEAIEQQPATGF